MRGYISFFEVVSFWFGDVFCFDGFVVKLDGGVVISFGCVYLSDDIWFGLDDGYGNEFIVFVL